ncbi:MAG: cysteine--tRNA ligase [bacterium]|nr:cysteine--tRNA ligase [bacterium]
MHIYDSLSGTKKILKKTRDTLRLFVCGPTVYDDSHIGHARTQIAFDIIVRYLRARGWKIRYLQNITDVDDKIIKRAKEENKNPLNLAKKFEKSYYEDLKALNVTQVDTFARASDFIPQIVKQVKTLIRKGYAYTLKEQGVYFDIKKFKDYGKLGRRTVTQAEDGVSRIDDNINKRNKGDFALWKFVSVPKPHTLVASGYTLVNGEPVWGSPLGPGRPGWHIEDTAITEKYFGPQYDLHGGGLDLKFPHHEAEIAQQEAASGKKPFVKIWLHAGLIRVNEKKMSKSLGNFITIKDFLKLHPQEVLRWIVLSHHYRSPANYSEKLAENAKESMGTLREFLEKLVLVEKKGRGKNSKIKSAEERAKKDFHAAMEDDFNTPVALAALFTLVNEINKDVWLLSKKDARSIKKFLKETLQTLGISLKTEVVPEKVRKLAEKRDLSRAHKQFMQADALRKSIEALGYRVEDTPLGPLVRKT